VADYGTGESAHMRAEEDQENTAACRETAKRNGISMEQADNCWEGMVGCPDCPFSDNKE